MWKTIYFQMFVYRKIIFFFSSICERNDNGDQGINHIRFLLNRGGRLADEINGNETRGLLESLLSDRISFHHGGVFLAAKLHYRPSQIALHDFSRSRHSLIGVGKQDWKEWIQAIQRFNDYWQPWRGIVSWKENPVEKLVGPSDLCY